MEQEEPEALRRLLKEQRESWESKPPEERQGLLCNALLSMLAVPPPRRRDMRDAIRKCLDDLQRLGSTGIPTDPWTGKPYVDDPS